MHKNSGRLGHKTGKETAFFSSSLNSVELGQTLRLYFIALLLLSASRASHKLTLCTASRARADWEEMKVPLECNLLPLWP